MVNPNQEALEYPFGGAPEPRPSRSVRRTAVAAVLSGLVVAAAGAPLGVLWHYLAPTVPVVDAGTSGFVVNDPSPEQYIAADGWFTIIGFVFGLLAAIVGWLVLRRHRGPGLLLGVTIGALAAAPVAWYTGRMIGRSAYEHWRAIAATGGTYQAPPDLHAKGALLVPAFAAVIVLTLLAGWSNDPDLDRPGAKPGYGHGLPSEAAGQGLSVEAAGQGLPGEAAGRGLSGEAAGYGLSGSAQSGVAGGRGPYDEAAGHGLPAQGGPGGPGDAASAGLPGQGSSGYAAGDAGYGLAGGEARPTADD